jgi:UDP-N-acetyl-D-galactosamine dehydrogenase
VSERGFAILGLGYVGLPVALAFARRFRPVIGFDISAERVAELTRGEDRTGEVASRELEESSLVITSDTSALAKASFFVVTVPTPIDSQRRPDLTALLSACTTIGPHLRPGSVVVFESTVYPGLTREICGPALARASGLDPGAFKLGYSPERINPGDRQHRLESIVKVVSGEDAPTLERVADAYAAIVPAGIHRAPSIEVAEAAKVLENTQRDINIALMNELSLILDRMGLRTADVLAAAATKWNFLRFFPGLVGGHCIGVDPYYLTAKAETLGYLPQVILAGRRINDSMGAFIAQRLVKLLISAGRPVRGARIGVLGLAFKEDVPDIRNSRVPDIAAELRGFAIDALIHDPVVDSSAAKQEYGVTLVDEESLHALDGLVIAVQHKMFLARPLTRYFDLLVPGGVIVDVKSVVDPKVVPSGLTYWSL